MDGNGGQAWPPSDPTIHPGAGSPAEDVIIPKLRHGWDLVSYSHKCRRRGVGPGVMAVPVVREGRTENNESFF